LSVPDSSLAPILAYLAVTAVLVITPGVGTASLIATVIAHGRKAGYLTAFGMVIGAAIYAVAAATGVSALLRYSPGAVRMIALAGGAFIIWLGAKGIVTALRPRPQSVDAAAKPADHAFVTTGIVIAFGNAPLPLFYLVVVPQYVPRGWPPLGGALLVSGMHLLMAGTWMTTLVTMLGKLAAVLRRPRVMMTMQLVTGAALILLGVRSIAGAI
jgi:threonine/homoserine/homoserine lactone efflux protein